MIEQQVQEQSQKLKRDFEQAQLQKARDERHAKLEDLRKDYDLKMAIINEIEEEKRIRQEYQENLKLIEDKKRHQEQKQDVRQFKQDRLISKQETDLQQRQQEEFLQAQKKKAIEENKGKVGARQAQELQKIDERARQLEEAKRAPEERQRKLDQAVEGLQCRPQVEFDSDRVKKETAAYEIKKGYI